MRVSNLNLNLIFNNCRQQLDISTAHWRIRVWGWQIWLDRWKKWLQLIIQLKAYTLRWSVHLRYLYKLIILVRMHAYSRPKQILNVQTWKTDAWFNLICWQSFSDNYKLHGKAKGFCSSRRWLHRFSEAEIMRWTCLRGDAQWYSRNKISK